MMVRLRGLIWKELRDAIERREDGEFGKELNEG